MQNYIIEELPQNVKDFLDLPESPYKNLVYFNDAQSAYCCRANLLIKDDGVIHYSYEVLRVKRNKNSFYLRSTEKYGFTFDKKLNVWFKKGITEVPGLAKVMKILKMDWYDSRLSAILTKGGFEKMLKGTITNPIDFCKNYLKSCKLTDVSPKLFYNLLIKNRYQRYSFMSAMEVAKDRNLYLMNLLKDDENKESYIVSRDYQRNSVLEDLVKQAQILDRKVDFEWSLKRLKSEHDTWTKEIMDMEGANIDDTPLDYIKKFDLLPEMTLLDSQKKVWSEGKLMKHCVYTNYWSQIKSGNYIAYHIETKDEVATLGIHVHDHSIELNQIYGPFNNPISHDLRVKIENWINNINKKQKL